MKVILVDGDDYSALTFEQANIRLIDAYEKAVSNGGKYTSETDDGYFEVKAYEFKEVDEEFVDFIKDEIEDYDYAKSKTFYVVEED